MENLIVQFTFVQLCAAIISIVGTLVWIAWVGSSRFSKIETDISWLKKSAEKIDDISKDLNELRVNSENIRTQLFAAHSPIRLTDKGNELLLESGLKQYIDTQVELVHNCKEAGLSNAYEVQSFSFDLFENIAFTDEFDVQIKQYAFDNGVSLDLIKRVGALYFRDICLKEMNMPETQ